MDPVIEDFGAGIDVNAQAAQQAQSAASAPAVGDWQWDNVRTKFAGLPDDITPDTFTDHVLSLQDKASKAEEYQQKLAAYEAQLVQHAQQQAAELAKSQQQASPAVDEFELPWKPVAVDPQFKSLVVTDPASGGWAPKNATNPVHIAAATEMNRRANYESQFASSLFDDPEGTVGKLTQRQMAALEKKMTERFEKFEQQFQPIQQSVQASQFEQQRADWAEQHADALFIEDGSMTPVGKQVDALLRTGKFTEDEALSLAQSLIAPEQPGTPITPAQPQPQRPLSISKAAAKTPSTSRFADNLSYQSRMMMDKTDSGVGNGKKTPTLADLKKEFGIWGQN